MSDPLNESVMYEIPIEMYAEKIRDAEKRGAVKALREQAEIVERDYVQFVNAAQGCPSGRMDDYWRWNGHAEALRNIATRLRKLAGDEVPAYGSKVWRKQHGATAERAE